MVTSNPRGGATSRQDTRYVFSMAVVEKMTGLTRRRIRYYEKQGLLQPGRSAGGHRLYSPTNVETLTRIKDIIKGGITSLEAVARVLASDLDRATPAYPRSSSDGDAAVRVMRPVPAPLSSSRRSPETDSPSYFRRVDVMSDADRKPTN